MDPVRDSENISVPAPAGGLALEDRPILMPAPPSAPPIRSAGRAAALFLGALVVVLAFLAASFPARNSDLWPHLAAGRLLAQGQYEFGHDPFVYGGAGGWWVNHSWLYDLLSYGLYRLADGTGLVIFKALLIAALALVLFGTGSNTARPATRATATALAIVALTPGLTLRPICVSYLFVGLTLWLLERGSARLRERSGKRGVLADTLSAYGWLLPLFALWANLDAWFLLGPLIVALYTLGSLLASGGVVRSEMSSGGLHPRLADPSPPRFAGIGALGAVLLAGLAVCLLNPHFFRVFELPAELGLSEAVQLLGREALPLGPSLSPFDPIYLRGPGTSVAGAAYYLLVLLSLGSFVLNRRWNGPRAVVWLGFLLLSIYQARFIAFFAVVAGPALAENLGRAWADRRLPVQPRLAIAGAAALCLVLMATAWPGWLMRGELAVRRGWTVEVDPALKQTADQLHQWRTTGKLGPNEHGLGLSRDIANVFTWFCPEEKGFFDSRLHLDAQAAAEYLAIRRGLAMPLDSKDAIAPDWRALLRRRKISHVVLLDRRDPETRANVIERCLAEPREWPMISLRGGVAVFGWRDPEQPAQRGRFAGWRPSLDRLAFGTSSQERAPAEGPSHDPQPRPWWSGFVERQTPWHPDREEAAFFGLQFKLQRARWYERVMRLYQNAAVSRAVGGPNFVGVLPTFAAAPLAAQVHENTWPDVRAFFFAHGDGPAALPFLAVRAARHSLAADPDDPAALAVLADAYLDLANGTQERVSAPYFPMLARLRVVQIVVSLNASLRLKPDNVDAHLKLASLYQEQRALDLALKHYQKAHRYLRARGPRPGQTQAAFDGQLKQIEEIIAVLDPVVEANQELYEVKTENVPVFDRANLAAAKLGLVGKALKVLTDSDYAAFGEEGMDLELGLLLFVGRTQDMRDWMKPWMEEKLGAFEYHWLRAQLEAATGHYAEADRALAKILNKKALVNLVSPKALPLRDMAATIIGHEVLDHAPGPGLKLDVLGQDLRSQLYVMVLQLNREAMVSTMRGLLALEAGQTKQAREHFRHALDIWQSLTLPDSAGPELRAGQALAQYGLDLLDSGQDRRQP
jgi:tetratricopeptide (TPR) repeat protein